MYLSDNRIEDYIRLVRPDADAKMVEQRATRLRARIADGAFDPRAVLLCERDGLAGTIGVRLVGEGQVSVASARLREPSVEVVSALLSDALARMHELGALRAHSRVDDRYDFDGYGAALEAAGFRRHGRRIEYKTAVEDLPEEDPASPLRWQTMQAFGFDAAVRLLGEVGVGDPDWEPDEDPAAFLRDQLTPAELEGEGDCVQVCFYDGAEAGIVVAHTYPSDGWASISYMGLHPRARGRGLGTHLQRRGFAAIRAQGGKLYHDGCSEDNAPMRRLFDRHGCHEALRMTEWSWQRP